MTRRLDLLIPATSLTAIALSLLACGGDTGDGILGSNERVITLCVDSKTAPLDRLAVGASLRMDTYVGTRPLIALTDCYGENLAPSSVTSSDPAIAEVVATDGGLKLVGKTAGQVTLTVEADGESWSNTVSVRAVASHEVRVRSANNALLDDLKPALAARLLPESQVRLEARALDSAGATLAGTFEGMWSVAPEGAASLQTGTTGTVTLAFGATPQAITVTSPAGGTRAVEPAAEADLAGVAVINSTTLTRTASTVAQEHAAASYDPQNPELLLVGLLPQDAEGRDLFGDLEKLPTTPTFELRAESGTTTDGLTLGSGTELDSSLGIAPGWSFTVTATKPAQASVVVRLGERELAVIPVVFKAE